MIARLDALDQTTRPMQGFVDCLGDFGFVDRRNADAVIEGVALCGSKMGCARPCARGHLEPY